MRATHSVLKPGAANCFYVITKVENLSAAEGERLARRDGNEHVESRVPYDVLMEEAGFIDVELTDVTSQYAKTLIEWKREWEGDADAFIELVGEQEFVREINNRNLDIVNTADGLLQRYQVYGVKP